MKSRYNSFCKECHRPILIGDEIEKRGANWVHTDCPTGNALGNAVRTAEKTFQYEQSSHVADTSNMYIEPKHFSPSKYQQDIFNFVANGNGNAVVEATAGSGKTTTIVHALSVVPEGKKVLFLAFNKHIVKELKMRAPSNTVVSTIHALGLSIIRHFNSRVNIDEEKVYNIMDDFWPIDKSVVNSVRMHNRVLRVHMRKLVGIAKSLLVDYDNPVAVQDMIDRYSIDMNGEQDEVVAKLADVMELCKTTNTVDFDDMPWLPVVIPDMKFNKFDMVFVDECQDLNNCNAKFLLQVVADNGRVVAVGDRNQSLYAFRGADAEAIPNLISTLHATVLPLSISYRCPSSHVAAIKKSLPYINIEPSDTAKPGKIETLEMKQFLDLVQPGDMVLCRTNAPLVAPAYECIKRGMKAVIRGNDIGRSLVIFIEKFEASDLMILEILMTEYTEKDYRRLMDRGKDLQAANVIEKLETIKSVMEHCKDVEDLKSKILILFDDSNVGVIFSSVHRAKGLEAERVFVLRRDLMPHPKAKLSWELTQENNVIFVAGTRSKNELYYVNDR